MQPEIGSKTAESRHRETLYSVCLVPDAGVINAAIIDAFRANRENPGARRSHYFAGRYENIYLDRGLLPGFEVLDAFWTTCAAAMLGLPKSGLHCGFWFNEMRPGQVTGPHCHDDDNELLSGVYYLQASPDSGDLVLHFQEEEVAIRPEAARLVLFAPDVVHEVTRNRSCETRLSIGMNFGIR